MSRVVELNSSNFDLMLRKNRRLFVDFWAPWCKPCERMSPLIERIAERYDSMLFGKLNVEEHSEIATRYRISSLPAYVIFRDSSPTGSKIGAISETELESFLSDTT